MLTRSMIEMDIFARRGSATLPIYGRFMEPDPVGYAAGANRYDYVLGDPVNFTDPLGLDGASPGFAWCGGSTPCNPDGSGGPIVPGKRGSADPSDWIETLLSILQREFSAGGGSISGGFGPGLPNPGIELPPGQSQPAPQQPQQPQRSDPPSFCYTPLYQLGQGADELGGFLQSSSLIGGVAVTLLGAPELGEEAVNTYSYGSTIRSIGVAFRFAAGDYSSAEDALVDLGMRASGIDKLAHFAHPLAKFAGPAAETAINKVIKSVRSDQCKP